MSIPKLRGADVDNAMILNARLEAKTARYVAKQERLSNTADARTVHYSIIAIAVGVVGLVGSIILGAILSPDQNAITRENSFKACIAADKEWTTDPDDKDKYTCLDPKASDLRAQLERLLEQ